MTCPCCIGSPWIRGAVVLGLAALFAGGMALAPDSGKDDKKPEAPREKEKDKSAAKEVKGDPWLLETCPVSGEKLGAMGAPVVLQHEGREIKFCCKDCVPKFKAEPAKYLQGADEKLIKQQMPFYPLDQCVVMPADKLEGEGFTYGTPTTNEHEGPINLIYKNRLVRFCCGDCVPKFMANPAEYLVKLDKAVIAKQKMAYPLEICPVSGEKLGGMGEPAEVVIGNRLVRLCCKSCIKELNKNPSTYLAKLEPGAIPGGKPKAPADPMR